MGCNYYLVTECSHCNNTTNIHIGKTSVGWVAKLRTYTEDEVVAFGIGTPTQITTWAEWVAFLRSADGLLIEDEFRRTMEIEDFIFMLEHRRPTYKINRRSNDPLPVCPVGYTSWEAFHKMNQSELVLLEDIQYRDHKGITDNHEDGSVTYRPLIKTESGYMIRSQVGKFNCVAHDGYFDFFDCEFS